MKKHVYSLLLSSLSLMLTAQSFDWGFLPEPTGSHYIREVASDGHQLFYTLMEYRGDITINGQNYDSHPGITSSNRPASLLICFEDDGSIRWVQNIRSQVDTNLSYLSGTALRFVSADNQGNVYVGGASEGVTTLDTAVVSVGINAQEQATTYGLVAKFDSTGKLLWHKTYTSLQQGNLVEAQIKDISVQPDGQQFYVVVAGDSLGTQGYSDPLRAEFVLRYSGGGTLQSPGMITPGAFVLNTIQLEASNNHLYMVNGMQQNNAGTLYQFHPGGMSFTSRSINGTVTDYQVADDTLYFCGARQGAMFVEKYAYATDSVLWSTYGDTSYQPSAPKGQIAVASDKSVFLQMELPYTSNGHFDHTPYSTGFNDRLYYGLLNADGALQWSRQADTVNIPYPRDLALAGNTALCLGNFNYSFSNSSQDAIFGDVALRPAQSMYNPHYLVSMGLHPPIEAIIDLPDTLVVCSGDSVHLPGRAEGGVGNTQFNWRNAKWIVNDTLAAESHAIVWSSATLYLEASDEFYTDSDTLHIAVRTDYFPLWAFFFPEDSANGINFIPGFGPMDADTVHWDFGDGNSSSDYSPYHQYSAGGRYIVQLYLGNPCGSSTWTDTLEVCDSTYAPQVQLLPNYGVQFSWNSTGASAYDLRFRQQGEQNWRRVVSQSTQRTLYNREPGDYEFYISEFGNVNPSCIGSFTVDCEDYGFSSNVFQINDATKGKIFLFGTTGGRRLWDYGLSDGQDTTWFMNRFSKRFIQLEPGTYYAMARDGFGCYSSQVDTLVIEAVDSSRIPNLHTVQNLGGGTLQANWSMANTAGVDRYQIRVKDVTGGGGGTLYNSYIAIGQQASTYSISGLPAGRYRIDVRPRINGSFQGSVYSNYRERIVASSKTDFLTSSSSEIALYPNPANDQVELEAAEGSEVKLFDMQGRVLRHFQTAQRTHTISLDGLASGTYVVQISANSKLERLRLIIQ